MGSGCPLMRQLKFVSSAGWRAVFNKDAEIAGRGLRICRRMSQSRALEQVSQ